MANKTLEVKKIGTASNLSDLLTKHLRAEVIRDHLHAMNFKNGDHKKHIGKIVKDDRWVKKMHNVDSISAYIRDGSTGNEVWEDAKFDLEESDVDKLVNEDYGDKSWLRTHSKLRKSKFTPFKVYGGPDNVGQVGKYRLTLARVENRGHAFETSAACKWVAQFENWKSLSNKHELGEAFVGYTVFLDSLSTGSHLRHLTSQLRGGQGIPAS